ncbi:Tripartite-type tricarboxylate transporter, receptor component TctC [Bradyrhizobium erythrophlei]|jgi:putative tricarboxylic transport membrane protein|nr:Tripartite-type tricarboxylate transporter, receptor component TctC [Bradyrhizobium erythrophlei]
MNITSRLLLSTAAILLAGAAPACAAWQPQKPIEFVATAGPGGGTDNLARAVQNIVTKYKLTDQPVVVVNKAGGSGAEGYVYGKASAGDPYKVIFGTSNAWQQPLVSKVAFNYTDLTPIAAMAQDEFLLWVKQDAPYKTATDFLKAAASGDFKMGGAQSKDTDEVLTRLIEKAAHVKFTYIPFKSGAEAAVQLAGGHIDSHVNNPSESLGQWRGGTQRPLCAFSPKRLPQGPKITATEGWSDIPTCVEQGLAISQYEQPRTVWLPGKVSADQTAFYQDLMKKVQATPEWKDYIEKSSQVDTFLSGDAFDKFIKEDLEHLKQVAAEQGWLVK